MARRVIPATPIVLGIDLGGTKIAGAAADLEGRLLSRQTVETSAGEGLESILVRLTDLGRALIAASGHQLPDVATIGIGAPGPTSPGEGIVFAAPNLPGWRDVPLRALVEARLGRPVRIDNDGNAAALAEHLWGAGRGVADMVYVTVGTGVGGGLILGGCVYRGAAGTAGEVGHTVVEADGPRCHCGNRGCLEVYASGTALARQAAAEIRAGAPSLILRLAGGDPAEITGQAVREAAELGDPLAARLMTRAGEYLGVAFASLVNLLAPARIVVGGGIALAGGRLLDPARRVMRERAFHHPASAVEVVEAQLGTDAGLYGAVALALGRDNSDAASSQGEVVGEGARRALAGR